MKDSKLNTQYGKKSKDSIDTIEMKEYEKYEKLERIAGELLEQLRNVGESDYSGPNQFTQSLRLETKEWIRKYDASEKKRQQEEKARQAKLRKSALNKLTPEEREALEI